MTDDLQSAAAENNFFCRHCGGKFKIVDTRAVDGRYRRRRYSCLTCGQRETSVEVRLGSRTRGGARRHAPDAAELRASVLHVLLDDADDVTLLNELLRRLDRLRGRRGDRGVQ